MTRRIVTGNREDGTSYFVSTEPTMAAVDMGAAQVADVWVDEQDRAASDNDYDPVADTVWKLIPPDGASVVRFASIMPDEWPDMPSEAELEEARKRFDLGGAMEDGTSGWHTTPTIDYGIVLEGEIVLELDEGEVTMGAGDIVIQRKTRHAWRNRSDKPCRMVFVLISSPAYQ
jgi:mannose-6-phosphate isomerase-like protein (cupin superfamily)